MKPTEFSPGKISEHLTGVGTVTAGMVRERAREIARINGRSPDHFSREDWEEARRELQGISPGQEERVDLEPADTPWEGPTGGVGHRAETIEASDEQEVAERLVEEGAEEANHDRMSEGTKHSHL
jgi:hypothetical protein